MKNTLKVVGFLSLVCLLATLQPAHADTISDAINKVNTLQAKIAVCLKAQAEVVDNANKAAAISNAKQEALNQFLTSQPDNNGDNPREWWVKLIELTSQLVVAQHNVLTTYAAVVKADYSVLDAMGNYTAAQRELIEILLKARSNRRSSQVT